MTRRSRWHTIASRIRWSGALAAVAALTALVAIGPPGTARAATLTGTGYDQITGAGPTDSAVTVSWKQGLLGTDNQPIAAANAIRSNPTGPLSFMYQDPDFQNLQVTVSKTQDITHQGVTVTWKGATPTIPGPSGYAGADFLQLMECYGDASTGPSPQGCEFGSPGPMNKADNAAVATRQGDLCEPGKNPDPNAPVPSVTGSLLTGCDTQEPLQGANPPDIDPASASNPQQYSVPFVPVSDPGSAAGPPAYNQGQLAQYFNQFNSNEVQQADTGTDGTGQLQFETLTSVEAPGLGCGEQESNGQVRNCWLVIVPRGQYEPNGRVINPSSQDSDILFSSPLSASNWAMRIQVHLDFVPIGSFCPLNSKEIPTIGTQVITRAVQSWQVALNQTGNCARVYGFSAVPETTSTQQLSTGETGLAFTTIPIGSEAMRPGGSGILSPLPKILYAPVAVSAVGFGFNINQVAGPNPSQAAGYVNTPIKLTPVLLAKAITQVYRNDLPDYYPYGTVGPVNPGPAWSRSNPLNISDDSQFIQVNPEVTTYVQNNSLAPLLTEDHSALNQQVWQWIQTDPSANAWLNQGTTGSGNSVTADPDYTALNLATPPAIDSFPRAYTGVLDLGKWSSGEEMTRRSLDMLPYVNDYDQAASDVVAAISTAATDWDPSATAPDGSGGWWGKIGAESLGHRFDWGISDTPDLAAYGLIDAQLCDNSGAQCVGPTTASVTTALDSAKPDSAGLLQVNPASPGSGGYPLVQVTYAAVDTTQPAADLTDDADLIAYAAGTGQTPGVAPGDLPPGYLPLPTSLQDQAMSVVAQLRADASGSSSPSTSASSSSQAGNGTGTTSLTPSLTTGSSATPTTGPAIIPPRAQLAAARTPGQPSGAIRWLLLAVVITGAACAVGGTVLRSAGVTAWLRGLRS